MGNIIVNFKKTASFDVDCQKGFTPLCPNELPVPGGNLIVEELNKQAKFAKYRVGSKDVHPSNAVWLANDKQPQYTPLKHINANIAWNAHCMSGTKGAELLDGLPNVIDYDFFVFKGIEPDLHPFSPIYHDLGKKISTGVIEWAKINGISTFLVSGLALNIETQPLCMGTCALDLKDAGFNVIVNLAATKGLGSEEGKLQFIEMLKNKNIIIINNTNELE